MSCTANESNQMLNVLSSPRHLIRTIHWSLTTWASCVYSYIQGMF